MFLPFTKVSGQGGSNTKAPQSSDAKAAEIEMHFLSEAHQAHCDASAQVEQFKFSWHEGMSKTRSK